MLPDGSTFLGLKQLPLQGDKSALSGPTNAALPEETRPTALAVNLGEQKHPSAGQCVGTAPSSMCQQTQCECISSMSTMAASAPSSRPSPWVGDTLVALAKCCGDTQLAVPTLTPCVSWAWCAGHGAWSTVHGAWSTWCFVHGMQCMVFGALPPAALQLLLLQTPGN